MTVIQQICDSYFVKAILSYNLKHIKIKLWYSYILNEAKWAFLTLNTSPTHSYKSTNINHLSDINNKICSPILWPLIHTELYTLLPSCKLACWEANGSSGFCNGYYSSTTILRELLQALLDACLVLVLRQIWDYYLHGLSIWLQTKGIQDSGLLARKDRWEATQGIIIKPGSNLLGKSVNR
jgi:hypothetical protein